MLRAIACKHERLTPIADMASIGEAVADRENTVWVDIAGPTPDEWACLRDEFAFHPLSLEDVERRHQRPKIDVFPDYYFMVVYALRFGGATAAVAEAAGGPARGDDGGLAARPMDVGRAAGNGFDAPRVLDIRELAIFLGANYMVTLHVAPIDAIDGVWDHWQRRTDVIGSDVGALLHVLLDHLIDDYFPVIDAVADRVEDLEESIFDRFDPAALGEIFALKKDLLALRRIVAPERDVLNVLLRRDPPILSSATVVFFQDVYDHALRVLDSIDTYRDLLSSALDAYLSVQSNNLNEIMRRLTVISTVFLPLTFLTGFFGMNFTTLPFANPALLGLGLALMVAIPAGMVLYFRWRGWS
ncbi:magnesium and cobalt transport protein CorA [bacterium]|nr:magnesium and cobalt transport protein CorA [Chloroflexi bacterium CFX6]RIL09743.1 MAG: magnesium and cobalt transport protein CorA [bacterium]